MSSKIRKSQQAAVGTFFHGVGSFFHGGVTFSHGIPCQCVCRTPVFWGLSQTSLPDFRQAAKNGSNFHDLGIARLPACLHFCHRKLTPNLGTPVIATSAMEVMRSGEARARYNKSSHLIFFPIMKHLKLWRMSVLSGMTSFSSA